MIEKAGQVGIEVRGVELDAREGCAGFEPGQLVLPVGADIAPEPVELGRLPQPGDRPPTPLGAEHHLAPGAHRHPRHRHHRPLVAGIEQAETLDLVTEELGPGRRPARGGIDVEDAAADGVLAWFLDQRFPGVSDLRQARGDLIEVGPRARQELDRGPGQRLWRQRWPLRGAAGGDDDAGLGAGAQRRYRFQAATDSGVASLITTQVVLGFLGLLVSLGLAWALVVATRRQTAHFRSLVTSSTDLVLVFGAGGCRYASGSVTTMLGCPDQDLLGEGFLKFVRPGHQAFTTRFRLLFLTSELDVVD